MLLWQPQQLFQAGFQLSFCVVFCIFLVMPWFDDLVQRMLRIDPFLPDELRPRWQITPAQTDSWFVCGLVSTSLAAWLGSIPLAAYYFHMFTPVSTFANVVAVPLCGARSHLQFPQPSVRRLAADRRVLFNYFGWLFMQWIHGHQHLVRKLARRLPELPNAHSFHHRRFITQFSSPSPPDGSSSPNGENGNSPRSPSSPSRGAANGFSIHSPNHLTVLPLNGGSAIYFDAPGRQNDLLLDCGNDDSVELHHETIFASARSQLAARRIALTVGADPANRRIRKTSRPLIPVKKVITSPV